MAVSMAVVPLLKGEEAKAILRDFEASKMRMQSLYHRFIETDGVLNCSSNG